MRNSECKNKFDQARFKKEITKAKKVYFSWPEEIYCEALKANVKITRTGWDHIVSKQRRTKNQAYFRAKNFPQARKLMETINLIQDIKAEDKNHGTITHWILQGVVDKAVIQVVIRNIGNQPKHFLSIVYKGGVPRRRK